MPAKNPQTLALTNGVAKDSEALIESTQFELMDFNIQVEVRQLPPWYWARPPALLNGFSGKADVG